MNRFYVSLMALMVFAIPVVAQQSAKPQVPAPWPAGPKIVGQFIPGTLDLDTVSFQNPKTLAWVPAVYNVQNDSWVAPAESQGWAIQFTGVAFPFAGGGTLLNTAQVSARALTNTGYVSNTCANWNADGTYEINFVPSNATDLQPKLGGIMFSVSVNQQWPNDNTVYTTVALAGIIVWAPANNNN